jgi:hypothetical protein
MLKITLSYIFTFVVLLATNCDKVVTNKEVKLISNNIVKGNFIGYRNNIPVFSALDKNILYTTNNGKVNIYLTYPSNYRVCLINEDIVIYQNKKTNEIMIEYINGEMIKISYNNFINSVSTNKKNDSIFFESPMGQINLLTIPNKEIDKIPLFGQYPKFVNGYLFFSCSDTSDASPLSALFKVKSDDFSKKTLVLKELIHEEWYLSTNGKYIACLINNNSKWRNAILKVNTGDIIFFDILNTYDQAYFSPVKDSFIFYNQNDILDTKNIMVE